jgi:hypothetical protein
LEFKVEHEQDIFSWDFQINLFLLKYLLLFKVNILYYNFQTQFAVFVYCSYQIPTLSYSPPSRWTRACACVLNTVLTVVYLAQMDPVCGREGALPALVPSCVGHVAHPSTYLTTAKSCLTTVFQL